MAKKIQGYIRLQLPAGAANPAPPVGPALGAQGVNIMAFCKEFNARTKDQNGMILPVVITVFSDKSFTFILKSPPASVLLKKAANIASGSAKPNQDKVGKVTKKQLLEIYNIKKADLNATTPEAGIKVIAGTARDADKLFARRVVRQEFPGRRQHEHLVASFRPIHHARAHLAITLHRHLIRAAIQRAGRERVSAFVAGRVRPIHRDELPGEKFRVVTVRPLEPKRLGIRQLSGHRFDQHFNWFACHNVWKSAARIIEARRE